VSLHPLLKQQFEDARQASGQLDLRKLLQDISAAYGEWDEERRGVVRSMKLLADETSAYTREVRESAASQLQVILDHVKDAILTVDEDGRVETLNSIGERVFGYEEDAVRGRKLDVLIPSLARRPHLTEALEDGKIGPGSTIVFAAFGGGFTWAAAVYRWGDRTEPLARSDAALPPTDKTALELLEGNIAVHGTGL
jgi:PAS domain-containing protein